MSMVINAAVPDRLWQQAQAMVEQGWVSDMESLIAESLRRYIDSHQEVITEQFIRSDIDWGLHGSD
ncbi:MAG: CopG family transcriptional regulator [Gammaproteobacteria bacterium RIFOXYA12_FULL_61_12]|nr:MAG: CopG family transcriptional regulator [Gammaproteobacteria bacterium RIFOXYD12_FULL_61_37]OGT93459.1 MAG: CopG family transcriptional regulator [Gammaproteobacteria bacterium RIFOXYA12_FULL_61_12]